MNLKRIGLRACAAEDLAILVPSAMPAKSKPFSEDDPMKIRHETEACFANRSEAVDFATKALGNPGNNRVWFSFYPFEEEGSERRFKVTVESTVET